LNERGKFVEHGRGRIAPGNRNIGREVLQHRVPVEEIGFHGQRRRGDLRPYVPLVDTKSQEMMLSLGSECIPKVPLIKGTRSIVGLDLGSARAWNLDECIRACRRERAIPTSDIPF
jgi:hypothetical protein